MSKGYYGKLPAEIEEPAVINRTADRKYNRVIEKVSHLDHFSGVCLLDYVLGKFHSDHKMLDSVEKWLEQNENFSKHRYTVEELNDLVKANQPPENK